MQSLYPNFGFKSSYSHKEVVDFFRPQYFEVQKILYKIFNIAVFDVQEPDHPLAWAMFKTGGMAGMRYTLAP